MGAGRLTNTPMTDPPHPGLALRYDWMEPLRLTVTEAAKSLGVACHGDPSG